MLSDYCLLTSLYSWRTQMTSMGLIIQCNSIIILIDGSICNIFVLCTIFNTNYYSNSAANSDFIFYGIQIYNILMLNSTIFECNWICLLNRWMMKLTISVYLHYSNVLKPYKVYTSNLTYWRYLWRASYIIVCVLCWFKKHL